MVPAEVSTITSVLTSPLGDCGTMMEAIVVIRGYVARVDALFGRNNDIDQTQQAQYNVWMREQTVMNTPQPGMMCTGKSNELHVKADDKQKSSTLARCIQQYLS